MLVFALAPAELLPTVQRLKARVRLRPVPRRDRGGLAGQAPRFEVVHHFYSTAHYVRVRLKTRVAEADPRSTRCCRSTARPRFMERECHDMYGILFRGNADLRPILLYEGFVGHPLRKDYPQAAGAAARALPAPDETPPGHPAAQPGPLGLRRRATRRRGHRQHRPVAPGHARHGADHRRARRRDACCAPTCTAATCTAASRRSARTTPGTT